MSKLKLYYIDNTYIEKLRIVDNKISQTKGERRPFVGIIVLAGKYNYFVPLTSPKEKHIRMRNSEDFLKIHDNNGACIGAINFNNMLPVQDLSLIKKVDFKSLPDITISDEKYSKLIQKQYNSIKKIRSTIKTKTINLRNKQQAGTLRDHVKNRCVDFKKIEEYLEK